MEDQFVIVCPITIRDAFKSIYNFKNGINDKGNQKSGIQYEKSLISDNLFKEAFSDEERDFLI